MKRKTPIKRKTPLKRSSKKIETPSAFVLKGKDGERLLVHEDALPLVQLLHPPQSIGFVGIVPAIGDTRLERELLTMGHVDRAIGFVPKSAPADGFDGSARKIDWVKMDEAALVGNIYDGIRKTFMTEDEFPQWAQEKFNTPLTPMQIWMRYGIDNYEPVCAECGKPLNFENEAVAYGSQAHILPKELFPSIRLHPANRVILGRWCCHGQYDSNWMNASKMKVWPHIKFIMFNVLIPALPQHEYRKLPDIIRDEYESLNRQ